jgi:hypothetical protein
MRHRTIRALSSVYKHQAQDLHRQQQLLGTMESIDMQELEQELTKTRGLFKDWADVTTKVAQETRSTHLTRLAAAKRGYLRIPRAVKAARHN